MRNTSGSPIGWYDAWRTASVGPAGFWRHELPRAHFRTASGATGLVATMVLTLLADHPEISTVVEIGAGDGRLLSELGIRAPQLRLIGLDLRRPQRLDDRVTWLLGAWDVQRRTWHPRGGAWVPLCSVLPPTEPRLVIAAEWLDELPAVVAERTTHGWREVLVAGDGAESPGAAVPQPDARWLDQWWPAAAGDRAESGRTRDQAWSALIDWLRPAGGLAIMIDYGHLIGSRPAGGTLTGYRHGRQQRPLPVDSMNLTAHVAVDSVRQAGEAAGARTEFLQPQREAVRRLLPGRTDGSGTLARLQAVSERRLLAETLGDHWWLVQSVRPERVGG